MKRAPAYARIVQRARGLAGQRVEVGIRIPEHGLIPDFCVSHRVENQAPLSSTHLIDHGEVKGARVVSHVERTNLRICFRPKKARQGLEVPEWDQESRIGAWQHYCAPWAW